MPANFWFDCLDNPNNMCQNDKNEMWCAIDGILWQDWQYICGTEILLNAEQGFYCFDLHDNMLKKCLNHHYGYYQCWDGEEWEHANWNENDGSDDNSLLTSLATDGIRETSPSID